MLTDTEQAVLDLEASWWRYAGAKDATVRDRFGMSATRYYQVLNGLIGRTDALEYAPMTVRRLVRLRDARRAERTARPAARG